MYLYHKQYNPISELYANAKLSVDFTLEVSSYFTEIEYSTDNNITYPN